MLGVIGKCKRSSELTNLILCFIQRFGTERHQPADRATGNGGFIELDGVPTTVPITHDRPLGIVVSLHRFQFE